MNNSIFMFPKPENEPVKGYAPGSPERKEIRKALDELYNTVTEIPAIIGGKEVKEVKGKRKQQYVTPWEKGSFNRIDYGITAAVSYWFVEVRYTFGMANVFKEGGKSTNHVISVTWSDIW